MLDYSLKDWNLLLIIYTSYFFASLYGFFFFFGCSILFLIANLISFGIV